jgi:nitroreductase
MSTISPADLIERLNWRYATKQFDPAKKIPADVWAAIEEALVLSPSSYGLQPYRFFLINDPCLRANLRPHTWGQSQVTDASHYVVFGRKQSMTEADVAAFISLNAQIRNVDPASLENYRKLMISDVVRGPRSRTVAEWAARQTYIALGNLLTSAALLGVDACPIEGMDVTKYDEILGLPASGYSTVCSCALGYRSLEDKYASRPKVRFPASELLHVL